MCYNISTNALRVLGLSVKARTFRSDEKGATICHYSLIEKAPDVVGPNPIKSISCSLTGKASEVIGLNPVNGPSPLTFFLGFLVNPTYVGRLSLLFLR